MADTPSPFKSVWTGAVDLIRHILPGADDKNSLDDDGRSKLKELSELLHDGQVAPSPKLPNPIATGSPIFEDDSPMAKKMKSIKVEDVYVPKAVVVLDADMSVAEVLSLFSDKHISSAPVVDTSAGNQIIGFVDVLDLAGHMLTVLNNTEVDPEAEFAKQSLRKVCAQNDEEATENDSTWVGIYEDDHLYHLMKIFGRGVHRAPVFRRIKNSKGEDIEEICGLVTQSNVIEYLYKNKNEVLGEIAKKPLSYFKGLVIPRDVIYSVKETEPAWRVYSNLHRSKISAAAIIGDDDVLLGNISSSHVKGLTTSSFSLLRRSVREFVEEVSLEKKMTALAAHMDSPLSSVLYHLKTSHMHRCWVVGHAMDAFAKLKVVYVSRAENTKLVGLVSLTDICKCLVGADASKFDAKKAET